MSSHLPPHATPEQLRTELNRLVPVRDATRRALHKLTNQQPVARGSVPDDASCDQRGPCPMDSPPGLVGVTRAPSSRSSVPQVHALPDMQRIHTDIPTQHSAAIDAQRGAIRRQEGEIRAVQIEMSTAAIAELEAKKTQVEIDAEDRRRNRVVTMDVKEQELIQAVVRGAVKRTSTFGDKVDGYIRTLDNWEGIPASCLLSPHLHGGAAVGRFRDILHRFPTVLTVRDLLENNDEIKAQLPDPQDRRIVGAAVELGERLELLHRLRMAAGDAESLEDRYDVDLGYLTNSFRRYGISVCTESHRQKIRDLCNMTINGLVGSAGKDARPHIFLTTPLPRQGLSLVLDEVRRELLRRGYFCVTVTYDDMKKNKMDEPAETFWREATRQLKCYGGDDIEAILKDIDAANLSKGVYSFDRFEEVVHGAWQTLRMYHLHLPDTPPDRLIVLAEGFTSLLDDLSTTMPGPELRMAVAELTNTYDGVSIVFAGCNVDSALVLNTVSGRPMVPFLMPPPVDRTHRSELRDMTLLLSVLRIPVDAATYNACKSSPGLLGALLEEAETDDPWKAGVLHDWHSRLLRSEMIAALEAAAHRPIDASSPPGEQLQRLKLGYTTRSPEPMPYHIWVQLHPAPLLWIQEATAAEVDPDGTVEGALRAELEAVDTIDWWPHMLVMLERVESAVPQRPAAQAIIVVSWLTSLTLKYRTEHNTQAGDRRDGLPEWRGVLQCAVALMVGIGLTVQQPNVTGGRRIRELLQRLTRGCNNGEERAFGSVSTWAAVVRDLAPCSASVIAAPDGSVVEVAVGGITEEKAWADITVYRTPPRCADGCEVHDVDTRSASGAVPEAGQVEMDELEAFFRRRVDAALSADGLGCRTIRVVHMLPSASGFDGRRNTLASPEFFKSVLADLLPDPPGY